MLMDILKVKLEDGQHDFYDKDSEVFVDGWHWCDRASIIVENGRIAWVRLYRDRAYWDWPQNVQEYEDYEINMGLILWVLYCMVEY